MNISNRCDNENCDLSLLPVICFIIVQCRALIKESVSGTSITGYVGSTGIRSEHVFLHNIAERGSLAEEVPVRVRVRVALLGYYSLLLLHILASQTEQEET